MASNGEKRIHVSHSTSVSSSGDRRRKASINLPPSVEWVASAQQPVRFSHYRVNSSSTSRFLVSPASASDSNHHPVFLQRQPKLLVPKIEPLETDVVADSVSINGGGGSRGFLRIRSIESAPMFVKATDVPQGLPSCNLIPTIESPRKRFQASSATSSANYWLRAPSPAPPTLRPSLRSSELSRLRRKKISDRIRIIESLMPWERRMDTGTLLEEAHKYVRFLEAQVAALRTMPDTAAFAAAHVSSGRGGDLLALEQLNRQQMLRVLVNSPRVQERLYDKDLCVFAAEQVTALRRSADFRALSATTVDAS
ncbi:uncharacterized protein LOC141819347 [Curcuma longa]|uniref:uncharacterized protein LOC141819347 n=1 Tax=Curcuma longa TaxID=136217 RepID=UPI003D9E829F